MPLSDVLATVCLAQVTSALSALGSLRRSLLSLEFGCRQPLGTRFNSALLCVPPQDSLEQEILQVLSDASGPVKTGQMLKKCQVPKKTLNQVLYRLKDQGKVSSPAPATWSLGGDASGDGTPAIPEDSTAQPSLGNLSCRHSRLPTIPPHTHLKRHLAIGKPRFRLGFKSELGHPLSVS